LFCYSSAVAPAHDSSTFGKLLKRIGPGFVTGTSDDDPSAIGTYSQTGAQFGLTQLWTVVYLIPFMTAIQEMCGRIGVVTGQGLAAVIRSHYARPILYGIVFIQVVTNTVNIGADLSAMAQSGQLLWHIPYFVWLIIVTAGTVPLIVFVPYKTYATYLKFLGLTLLTYVAAATTIAINWREVLSAAFSPRIRLDKDFLLNIVAVLGATISPYEFFWQGNEEVEELIAQKRIKKQGEKPVTTAIDFQLLRVDTFFGMFFSNFVAFFIILTTAYTLGRHGIANINTAADAAQALRPLAGPLAFWLFALGILSVGLLSIPVLAASSAYAVSGALDWPRSLARNFRQEPGFYGVLIFTSLLGLSINLLPIPPFKMLYYTAILNGIISPPLLFMVMSIAGDPRIMGKHANSAFMKVMGWTLFAFTTAALVVLLLFLR
jgi:NRAMP (natural resistance-associated macrophage protein)-like metal ion transporter